MYYFKNAMVFRSPDPITVTHDDLMPHALIEPSATQYGTTGFVPPFPGTEDLAPQVQGFTLLSLCLASRDLPSDVVKRAVIDAISERTGELGRELAKEEQMAVRESVQADLLAKAHVRYRTIRALIYDTMLIVDSSSPGKCDTVTSAIRNALGRLKISPIHIQSDPKFVLKSIAMNGHEKWHGEYVPGRDIALGSYIEVFEPLAGGTIKATDYDLTSDVVRKATIQSSVLKLGMILQDTTSFRLCPNLRFTKIDYAPEIKQQAAEGEDGSGLTTTLLMGSALLKTIEAVARMMGGEVLPSKQEDEHAPAASETAEAFA